MTTNKAINILSAGLVLFLATAAFVLSYSSLKALAIDNGISEDLAFLWPLCLDAVQIAASLAVVRASLHQESKWYQWSLVGLFSALSILFNIVHAPDTLLARAIFGLPPLTLFLSFELAQKQVEASAKRNKTLKSLAELSAELSVSRSEVDALTDEAATLSGKRDALNADLVALRKEKKAVKSTGTGSKNGNAPATTGDETREKATAILAAQPDISGAALGRELGRSDSLGRQLKRELASPPASANGNGGRR